MAEKKKEAKRDEGLKVTNVKGILRVVYGDDFVEGKAKLSFGLKRKVKNMSTPKKMTVKGEDDPVTMYMDDDYSANKDVDLYILDKALTKWSSDNKLNWKNLQDEVELVDLLEKFVEEFKKINGLVKDKKADEEKN